MAKHNYLVSVFVNGRNVNSYFSENLDDLVTIKAMHRGCEINIFDITNFSTMLKEQVDSEIQKSGERWKKSLEIAREISRQPKKPAVKKVRRKRERKNWERPIMCVETGQIFPSIKRCAEHLGILHKSLWNAINSGKTRNGLHFVNAGRINDISEEE